MNIREIQVIPIVGFPIIQEGDDLSELLLSSLDTIGLEIQPGDILVVSHSIVSIAEGSVYSIADIIPSMKAKKLAIKLQRSAAYIEAVLQEASEVIRESPVLITRTKQGIITDFSGIDESNAPRGKFVTMPRDPDTSAKKLSMNLSRVLGFNIPVVITDTQGRPWRKGAVNLAIGVAGMSPFDKNAGKTDIYHKRLRSSLVCLADELAASAELVMGQADERVPLAIIRGVGIGDSNGSAQEILRDKSNNLFS